MNLSQLLEDPGYYMSGGGLTISMACPEPTKALLASNKWVGKTGELATKMVDLQLKIYNESMTAQNRIARSSEQADEAGDNGTTAARTTMTPIPTLFDIAAETLCRLFEMDPENVDTMMYLLNPGFARAAWKWHTVPYTTFSILRALGGSDSEIREKIIDPSRAYEDVRVFEKDVDMWILRNEEWLRRRMRIAPTDDWRIGLITIDTIQQVLHDSTLTAKHRRISRLENLDGFTFLNAKRLPYIYIQSSSEGFRTKLDELVNGQLNGLDWSNILIAGGIILGSLLCVDGEEIIYQPSMWKKSDIDIYIYGLDPLQANKKIEHLFDIFKANLPKEVQDSIIVVKNSKTITFLAPFPHRRFQIILKLVKSPAEVLLNFDLDICAMGYNGEKLYMLPRAVRALETGYNTFTMDMVHGHYLGERRASQEQRVFKYASKGYGIRLLPGYIEAQSAYEASRQEKREDGEEEDDYEEDEFMHESRHKIPIEPISSSKVINSAVAHARDYFERIFRAYMSWTRDGRILRRHYSDSPWKGTKADPPSTTLTGKRIGGKDGIPIFTHALLDTIDQVSTEPLRRSCLTGFELFFRHVALWEAEQQERLYIQDDVWASTTYDVDPFGVSYEDLPQYAWDETFSTEDFLKRATAYNQSQTDFLDEALDYPENRLKGTPPPVSRILAGHSLSDVMLKDLVIPIWLPVRFVNHVNQLIQSVAKEYPHLEIKPVLGVISYKKQPAFSFVSGKEKVLLVNFRVSSVTMWQQLDRRLDELFEVIWSFMHANQKGPGMDNVDRTRLFIRQLSNRAIRAKKSWKDEIAEFNSWLKRDPGPIGGYHYGSVGQGFWWDVDGVPEENRDGWDGDEEDDMSDEDYMDYYPPNHYPHFHHFHGDEEDDEEDEDEHTDSESDWVTTSGESNSLNNNGNLGNR